MTPPDQAGPGVAEHPYAYIRQYYGVQVEIGQRITVAGKPGTVKRPRSHRHYLTVLFDGHCNRSLCHPTDYVNYAPEGIRAEP